MPYGSNEELPPAVRRRYSDRCQTVFRKAFNGHEGTEASRFAVAHTAAANCMMASKDLQTDIAAGYASDRMEHKAFAVKDMDLTDEGEVKVAFAEFETVDREGDYTFAGSMPSGKELPISAFSHASWPAKGGLPPTGRGSIKEDGSLAVFAGKFFLKTTHGRDAYETVKGMGDLQEWSYGYEVLEKAAPPQGVKAKRGLKRLDVFEISPVLIGAGGRTFTMGIKSIQSEFSDAQWALGSMARLLQATQKREGGDTEVTRSLESAMDSLRNYIRATVGKVGSEEDLAEIAAEQAAILGKLYADPDGLLKDGPLAGLSFAEMSSRVLRDVEAFTGRASAIAEMRLKEGRKISTARLAELTGSRERLAEAIAAIDKIVAEANPATEDAEAEGKARALRLRSRLAVAGLELASVRIDN